jgi:iron(III) transport system substrate-binding protein
MKVSNRILRMSISLLVIFCFNTLFYVTAIADSFSKDKLTESELIAGSKKEKELVFYTSIPVKSAPIFLKAFAANYPWVKTNFIRSGGPVLAQKFYAEKGRKIEKVDVVNSGASEVYPDWRNKGYLAKIDNLPEFNNLRKLAKGPKGYYAAWGYVSHPIFWNTKLLNYEQVPDDLWEFTKPEWKDKAAAGNPAIGGAAMNWFSWVCECRKQISGGNRPSSGLGIKWMEAMHNNGILLPGQVGALTNTIITGRRHVGLQQWIGVFPPALKGGAPLDYKYPKQGTIGQSWVGAVNKKAPHPYTARLFMNWFFKKEAQILLIKYLAMHAASQNLDTQKYFPFKRGTVPFNKLWIMDLESIGPKGTKAFVGTVMKALTGSAVK